jgi:hypothetical protein
MQLLLPVNFIETIIHVTGAKMNKYYLFPAFVSEVFLATTLLAITACMKAKKCVFEMNSTIAIIVSDT